MSIADMCKGDTIVKQSVAQTQGNTFGNTPAASDGSSFDCNVQTMNWNESLAFDARGEMKLYDVYFATDPSLAKNNRLKWTKTDGNGTTFSSPRILKVLATAEERNPDGTLALYIAKCELETTERQS